MIASGKIFSARAAIHLLSLQSSLVMIRSLQGVASDSWYLAIQGEWAAEAFKRRSRRLKMRWHEPKRTRFACMVVAFSFPFLYTEQ